MAIQTAKTVGRRRTLTSTAIELLQYHQRFGHISIAKLQSMAKQGIILLRLAKCPIPSYSAWLTCQGYLEEMEGQNKEELGTRDQANQARRAILVDQLVSLTPGLIMQIDRMATNNRYQHTTMFVNPSSS